jgi:RNA polymerase sigma-70 factor (ECF subfamily)
MTMTAIPGSTEKLVAAARKGDRRAFAEIVKAERDRLVMSARALTSDWHEAEDAVQDAFVLAWRHLPDLREVARFRPWLLRILVREAGRRRKRRGVLRALEDESALPARPDHGDPRLAALVDEVERLPDKYRVPLSLFYLAGLSYREVADTTGLPEKRVKSRLYDARERLRRRLSHG